MPGGEEEAQDGGLELGEVQPGGRNCTMGVGVNRCIERAFMGSCNHGDPHADHENMLIRTRVWRCGMEGRLEEGGWTGGGRWGSAGGVGRAGWGAVAMMHAGEGNGGVEKGGGRGVITRWR